MIEINPASISQIMRGRNGKLMMITDDVTGVASQLKEIDSNLHLAYNENGGFFVVYHREGPIETLVLTANECDKRIVDRVRYIDSSDYDFVTELEKQDAKARKEQEHEFSEKIGDGAERLAHAVRKDYFGADTGRYFFKDRSKKDKKQ